MTQGNDGSGNCTRPGDTAELVEVMFAKSREEAEDWRNLLEENAIPAHVEEVPVTPASCGVAVRIPADRLLEASELLAVEAGDNGDICPFEDAQAEDEDVDDEEDEQEEGEGEEEDCTFTDGDDVSAEDDDPEDDLDDDLVEFGEGL